MKSSGRIQSAIIAGFVAAACTNAAGNAEKADSHEAHEAHEPISKTAIEAAQKEWGEGIVAIASAHTSGDDYAGLAGQHIDNLYAYDQTDVMFKPTLAAEDQFRETYEEALSYFIGSEGTEDAGFATKGWTDVRWESNGIYTDGDSAMAMGNYYFTGPDGSETKVEYTFGYVLDDAGDLKINLHHSSLPYSAG